MFKRCRTDDILHRVSIHDLQWQTSVTDDRGRDPCFHSTGQKRKTEAEAAGAPAAKKSKAADGAASAAKPAASPSKSAGKGNKMGAKVRKCGVCRPQARAATEEIALMLANTLCHAETAVQLSQASPASSKGKGGAAAGRSRKRPVVLSDSDEQDGSDVSIVLTACVSTERPQSHPQTASVFRITQQAAQDAPESFNPCATCWQKAEALERSHPSACSSSPAGRRTRAAATSRSTSSAAMRTRRRPGNRRRSRPPASPRPSSSRRRRRSRSPARRPTGPRLSSPPTAQSEAPAVFALCYTCQLAKLDAPCLPCCVHNCVLRGLRLCPLPLQWSRKKAAADPAAASAASPFSAGKRALPKSMLRAAPKQEDDDDAPAKPAAATPKPAAKPKQPPRKRTPKVGVSTDPTCHS